MQSLYQSKSRIKALDSLRGIAAGTVVIGHVLHNLIKGHSFDEYTPLYIIRAAHESVIFFFLLSGYVLTYQVVRQGYFNYKQFIVQRLFRIYIPYLSIIIITFIFFALFNDTTSVNNSNQTIESHKLFTFESILNHLLLIGNFDTNQYNPVIWSLVHEMRISILFPILFLLISNKWKYAILTGLFLSLLAGFGIIYGINPSRGYNNSYLYTMHYFSIFLIGGLIVKNLTILINFYKGLNSKLRFMMLIIALLIFIYGRMLYLIPHKFGFYKLALFNEIIADWLTAASSAYFIITALNIINKQNWLLHPIPLTLGKISYSLYLIHVPVIFVCTHILLRINDIVVMMISIVCAVILSMISHKYIEKPSSVFGKHFSKSKKTDFQKTLHLKKL